MSTLLKILINHKIVLFISICFTCSIVMYFFVKIRLMSLTALFIKLIEEKPSNNTIKMSQQPIDFTGSTPVSLTTHSQRPQNVFRPLVIAEKQNHMASFIREEYFVQNQQSEKEFRQEAKEYTEQALKSQGLWLDHQIALNGKPITFTLLLKQILLSLIASQLAKIVLVHLFGKSRSMDDFPNDLCDQLAYLSQLNKSGMYLRVGIDLIMMYWGYDGLDSWIDNNYTIHQGRIPSMKLLLTKYITSWRMGFVLYLYLAQFPVCHLDSKIGAIAVGPLGPLACLLVLYVISELICLVDGAYNGEVYYLIDYNIYGCTARNIHMPWYSYLFYQILRDLIFEKSFWITVLQMIRY
jgi:hypothetical protein